MRKYCNIEGKDYHSKNSTLVKVPFKDIMMEVDFLLNEDVLSLSDFSYDAINEFSRRFYAIKQTKPAASLTTTQHNPHNLKDCESADGTVTILL